MTAASSIRLLLVSANPETPELIRTHLDRSELRYGMHLAPTREQFFQRLRRRSPDLILSHLQGTEGVTLREILQAAEKHDLGIPVVILSEQGREQSAIHVLEKGAPEYLHQTETDYLPLRELDRISPMVERSVRAHRTRISHMRLENEVRHASSALRESQRLVTIGRLTGSIAHEINNPLESVTNLLFLIEHEPGVPARVRDYLKMAQLELDRAVRISKQTLNFYRDTIAPVPTRLSQLLNEVLVLYERRIAGKEIEVVRRFGEEEQVNIFPGEIRQVFSNLIANAIEATGQKGRLFLRVRSSRLWSDPEITGLRVTVADTGVGMTPEVRRRIGEPFFTTKGQGGTGLGLWVCQSITERHGGNMLVRSSTAQLPGQPPSQIHGTVFSIFLPIELRPRAVEAPSGAKPPFAGLHFSRAKRASPRTASQQVGKLAKSQRKKAG